MATTNLQSSSTSSPKYLWFLTLCYTMIIVLANWFDPRLVKIAGLVTDAGTLIFPFTFLLSALITEVYDYKNARRAIWIGFLFNGIFVLYAQLVIHLPSPDYPNHNALFDQILAFDTRIIIASAISYLISEPTNSLMMAKLKLKTQGKYLGLRYILSTFFAACIDSFVFGTLGFYGLMTNSQLLKLILTMWLIKVIIEIFGLSFSIPLTKRLKAIEQIDIYDQSTRFNLFSFDSSYSSSANHFKA